MSGETTFILLFIVATAVAIVVQRLKIPYTAALVASGLLLGSIHALEPPILTKELLYTVFLRDCSLKPLFISISNSSGAIRGPLPHWPSLALSRLRR